MGRERGWYNPEGLRPWGDSYQRLPIEESGDWESSAGTTLPALVKVLAVALVIGVILIIAGIISL